MVLGAGQGRRGSRCSRNASNFFGPLPGRSRCDPLTITDAYSRYLLARLFVVLLVEAPHQLLEDGAHPVIVEAGVLDRAVAVHDRGGAEN